MAQITLSGRKQRVLVMKKGKPVARIDYRRVRNPKTGKIKHVLGGPIKLLPKPHGEA